MKEDSFRNTDANSSLDYFIRALFAGLVAVMVVSGSVSLLIGQPFLNGTILLIFAIILAGITLNFRQFELMGHGLKLRLRK